MEETAIKNHENIMVFLQSTATSDISNICSLFFLLPLKQFPAYFIAIFHAALPAIPIIA